MTANRNFFLGILRSAIHSHLMAPSQTDDVDWQSIYRLAREQNVVGIIFEEIQKQNISLKHLLPAELVLRWYAESLQIKSYNARIKKILSQLTFFYRRYGFTFITLKGLGLAQLYMSPDIKGSWGYRYLSRKRKV